MSSSADLPEQEPEASGRGGNRHRSRALMLSGAIGLAGAATVLGLWLSGTFSSAAPITAHGSFLVADTSGDSASSDYPDISDGTQVVVVDSNGTVIATGALHSESLPKALAAQQKLQQTLDAGLSSFGVDGTDYEYFTFSVTVPAGQARYGIRAGNSNRGTLWESAKEMKAGPALCLGDGCNS